MQGVDILGLLLVHSCCCAASAGPNWSAETASGAQPTSVKNMLNELSSKMKNEQAALQRQQQEKIYLEAQYGKQDSPTKQDLPRGQNKHPLPTGKGPQGSLLTGRTESEANADESEMDGEDEADSELDDLGNQDDESMHRDVSEALGAQPRPFATWPGQEFDGYKTFLNLKDDPDSKDLHVTSPFGAFSFYAEVRFDSLKSWNRIFDFGDNKFHHTISAGIISDSPYLYFEVHNGAKGAVRALQIRDTRIKIRETHKYLFTVNEKGIMRVWEDGVILKEASGDPPDDVDRPFLYIGKANFNHHGSTDRLFKGAIKDIRIWHEEVDWNTVLKAAGAANWPGLVNGGFDDYEVPWVDGEDVLKGTPPGWMSAMNESSTSMVYLQKAEEPEKNPGEEIPPAAPGAFAALKGQGAVLVQDVALLNKDTVYFMAFKARSMDGQPGNLRVSVDGVPYLDQIRFATHKFSTQLISFAAQRFDGKATVAFENVSPEEGGAETPNTVYVDDIRISPAPHCYRLWKWNSFCPQSNYDQGGQFIGLSGEQCRKKCQDINCHFMLYDPVSFRSNHYGHSICDVYMECKRVAVFYGGKFGSVYQRVPCAMGGTLFQEEAVKYPLPDVPSTFWKTVPGVNEMAPDPDALPGAAVHRRRRSDAHAVAAFMPVLRDGVEYKCPMEDVKSGHIDLAHCNTTNPEQGAPKLPCQEDLVGHGIGNIQIIKDAFITASSYFDDGSPGSAALHGKGEMWRSRILDQAVGDPKTSWRAAKDEQDQWIQWDFGGSIKHITQIETQAAAMPDPLKKTGADFVTKYRIEYWLNGLWIPYKEELQGNKKAEEIKVAVLSPSFNAEKVRLIPTAWNNHVSMRAGLVGCGETDPDFPHPKGPPANATDNVDARNPPAQSLTAGSAEKTSAMRALDSLRAELDQLRQQSEYSSLLSKDSSL